MENDPDLYRRLRDSQLIGMSGFSKEGLPVIAVGVGLSTFDEEFDQYYVQLHIQINEYRDRMVLPTATKNHGRHIHTCVEVLDMTGLKLSSMNQLNLLTAISTIDDLNYPKCVLEGCKASLSRKNKEESPRTVRLWHGGIAEERRIPGCTDIMRLTGARPAKIAKTIETEFHKLESQNGLTN